MQNIFSTKKPEKLLYKLFKKEQVVTPDTRDFYTELIDSLSCGQIINPNNKYIKRVLEAIT